MLITESLSSSTDDASMSVNLTAALTDLSSTVTECRLGGYYSFSVDDCVEILQPTTANCSGIIYSCIVLTFFSTNSYDSML